jgi:hypothetical protein
MASRGGAGAGAGGWDSLDDDDWGLTEEQFDKLEQDAYRVLAERKASSSAASTAPIASPLPHRAPVSPAATASSPLRNDHPASRISLESRFGKVRVSSALSLFRFFCGGLLLVVSWGLGLPTQQIGNICCSDGQMRSEFRAVS